MNFVASFVEIGLDEVRDKGNVQRLSKTVGANRGSYFTRSLATAYSWAPMDTNPEQIQVSPYGSWPSNITSELMVQDAIHLGQIKTDGDSVYWIEGRPTEQGRSVLVRRGPDARCEDITPLEFSVRTRAHEYGGGDFFVHGGVIFFSNDKDRCLYRSDPGSPPVALTSGTSRWYADGTMDATRNRIVCVVEEETSDPTEPRNFIGVTGAEREEELRTLVSGNDFYSNPTLSNDDSKLAYLTWNHPNMPWDGTELRVARLDDSGAIQSEQCIAGGREESVFQPQWSSDGSLYFVSDRTGWWNLYCWDGTAVEPVFEGEAELGRPQWVFGMSTYALLDDARVVASVNERGVWRLCLLDRNSNSETRIKVPDSEIHSVHALPDGFVYCGASPREAEAVVGYRLEDRRRYVIRRSVHLSLDSDELSFPRHITFAAQGEEGAHAFYYPPANPEIVAAADQRPPLIVKGHGGPTSAASTALDLRTQFWTSRGFAVLDVNYRGSTGFGRPYRNQLKGSWGVADVQDCIAGAKHLVEQGLADPERLIITGRSAGGYTTLAALTFEDVFRAGTSYYGISDLEALLRDTHKFESRYLDGLVGAYPEELETYRERSPIHFTHELGCPVAFFQGLQDKVVPPSQAEEMVEALRNKGIPVAYMTFPEEGHGFRGADAIRRSIDGELYFYCQVFGIERDDLEEPIVISNLERSF